MLALKRIQWRLRSAKAREWGARGLAAQSSARVVRGPDAFTELRRARDDARGQIMREGITYYADGRTVEWQIVRSRSGRTDQFDIIISGELWRTGGARRVAAWLRA